MIHSRIDLPLADFFCCFALVHEEVRFACAAEALSVEPGLGAKVAGQVHVAAAVDRGRVRRVVLATAEDFRPQVASARCVERQEYVPPLHGS